MAKKKKRPEPASLGLPAGGADAHAHLDLGELAEDLPGVLDRARGAGVSTIVNVYLGPRAYGTNSPALLDKPGIGHVVGIHPNDVGEVEAAEFDELAELLTSGTPIRALGEIGLDHYWDKAPKDVQERLFRDQLALARERDLPVVIHCRDALESTLAILEADGWRDRPLLWHCFGERADVARRIMAAGWCVSVPGTVTYRKNDELRDAMREIDPARLMIETDCPYLAPEPWRGKRNEPALAVFTAAAVAEATGRDASELWVRCGENVRRFFSLESAAAAQ
jgi:TatD DNase family protein